MGMRHSNAVPSATSNCGGNCRTRDFHAVQNAASKFGELSGAFGVPLTSQSGCIRTADPSADMNLAAEVCSRERKAILARHCSRAGSRWTPGLWTRVAHVDKKK